MSRRSAGRAADGVRPIAALGDVRRWWRAPTLRIGHGRKASTGRAALASAPRGRSAGAGPAGTLGRWTSTSPPEHALLRDTIRDFMLTEVAPVIEEHERERRFPVEIVRRLGEIGWLGIPIPEDEGGAGLDTLAYAIAVEEIGRVWGSLGLIVAAHTSLGCGPLHLAGTDEQKERFLVPMAQRQGHRRVRADRAGRRLRRRRHADDRPPRGRPDGGTWVIDGGKRFITNAGQAGTYIVTARTGDARRRRRRDQRVHRPGRHARASASAGSRTSSACTRRRPASCSSTAPASRPRTCSASRASGFRTFLKILDGGRISIGALAVGLAQARARRRDPVRADARAVRPADRHRSRASRS